MARGSETKTPAEKRRSEGTALQRTAGRTVRCAFVVSAAGVAALLVGCMVGPDYRAPPISALKVPAQFNAIPAATSTDVDIGAWWRAFDDPTLTTLVERGLAANLDIDAAGARVRKARADLKAAHGAQLPTLDVFASQAQRVGRDTGGPRSTFQAGFDAAYEADIFGGIRRSVEAAHATAQGAEASLRSTQLTVAAEIALNYLDAREAQARLRIAHDTLKTLDDTVDIVGWRLKAGLVSDLDLQQARQLRAQTAASIPALDVVYAAAANRLAVLLDEAPGAVDALLEPAVAPPAAPAVIPAAIPADVVRRRPDVAFAERTLAAETARIGVETAQLYPALSLSGTFAGSGASISKAADNAAGLLIAAISAPVFHGGQIRAAIEAQRATTGAALDAYRASVLNALEETENAMVAISKAAERERSLAEAETAARNAAELARIEYRSGRIDFQTQLDSERTLLSSQDSLVSTQVARDTAAVQLFKALGGGWQVAPQPPSVTAP